MPIRPLTEVVDKCNIRACAAMGQIPRSTERTLVYRWNAWENDWTGVFFLRCELVLFLGTTDILGYLPACYNSAYISGGFRSSSPSWWSELVESAAAASCHARQGLSRAYRITCCRSDIKILSDGSVVSRIANRCFCVVGHFWSQYSSVRGDRRHLLQIGSMDRQINDVLIDSVQILVAPEVLVHVLIDERLLSGSVSVCRLLLFVRAAATDLGV